MGVERFINHNKKLVLHRSNSLSISTRRSMIDCYLVCGAVVKCIG